MSLSKVSECLINFYSASVLAGTDDFASQATIFTLSTFASSEFSLNSTSINIKVQMLSQNLFVSISQPKSKRGQQSKKEEFYNSEG